MTEHPFDPEQIERHAQEVLATRVESRAQRWDVEGQLSALQGKLAENARGNARRTPVHVWRYLSIAAALIVCMIGIRHVPNMFHTTPSAPQSKTYTTTTAQRAKITLSNGAQVTLAPATKLVVTGNQVTLTGQALFTVLHKSGTPFTVRASNATIRVLGTTFSVRAYDDDKSTRVVVAEGKVGVVGQDAGVTRDVANPDAHPRHAAAASQSIILATGDAATVQNGQITLYHDTNIASALAWAQGALQFNEAPFQEVIPELERWYGIRVHVTNSRLNRRTVTMTIDAESASQAIDLLANVLHARAIRGDGGRSVTFTPISEPLPVPSPINRSN